MVGTFVTGSAISIELPFFVYCGVGTWGANCIATYSAVMLAKFAKKTETKLAFWLFLVVLFVDELEVCLDGGVLGTLRVAAFLVALGPRTEAAILKEPDINVCALPNFFRADPLLMLESSFILSLLFLYQWFMSTRIEDFMLQKDIKAHSNVKIPSMHST